MTDIAIAIVISAVLIGAIIYQIWYERRIRDLEQRVARLEGRDLDK